MRSYRSPTRADSVWHPNPPRHYFGLLEVCHPEPLQVTVKRSARRQHPICANVQRGSLGRSCVAQFDDWGASSTGSQRRFSSMADAYLGSPARFTHSQGSLEWS